MDNTKVPPPLIFCKRRSLEEFFDKNTLNETLVDNMSNVYYMQKNFKERALKCMNTAYYICTLMLREKHPEWSFDTYCDLAFCNNKDSKVNQAVTLSLVSIYINGLCEEQRQKLKKLKKQLDDFMNSILHFIQWCDPFLNDCRYADILKIIKNSLTDYSIDENEFAFRVIDKEAVRDVMSVKSFNWVAFVDYFRESRVRELVEYYGSTEDEKLNVVDILRQAANGFYTMGFNDKPEQVNKMLDTIEDEIHHHYNQESEKKLSVADNAELESKADFATYKARIKKLESELSQKDQLLEEVKIANVQQKNKIKDLDAEVESLRKQLEEASTIPDTVTAQQRVRMELARKLMEAAGINEDILKKWGNKDKAGTLMGTMLDIVSSTCKTYLSDPCMNSLHHEETIKKINPLLEALNIKFRL